ncbi:MAG: hypothetical protein R3339_09825, partial [Thermodesulfobacteriota bacterium]|nr:hypothetical protein [Thermodesulfobacteriota bacterium]
GGRSEQGTIVCATCHLMPKAEQGNVREEKDSVKGFIRRDIAETFCKTCHGNEALIRFLYFHSKW